MTTKKKPVVPAPLLKLKFEKFPDKPVPVFFDAKNREFDCHFGFERYAAPSVAALEQKIKKAIKAGATPSPAWTQMIELRISTSNGRGHAENCRDVDFGIDAELGWFRVGAGGKIYECHWHVSAKDRPKSVGSEYWAMRNRKVKNLATPIFVKDSHDYEGGCCVHALLPFDSDVWKEISDVVKMIRAGFATFITDVAARGIESFLKTRFQTVAVTPSSYLPKLSPPAGTLSGAKKPRAAVSQTTGTPDRARSKPQKKAGARAPSPAVRPLVNFHGQGYRLSLGPLNVKLQNALHGAIPDMTNAYVLKDGRIQVARGIYQHSPVDYITAERLQEILTKAEKQPGLPLTNGEDREPAEVET